MLVFNKAYAVYPYSRSDFVCILSLEKKVYSFVSELLNRMFREKHLLNYTGRNSGEKFFLLPAKANVKKSGNNQMITSINNSKKRNLLNLLLLCLYYFVGSGIIDISHHVALVRIGSGVVKIKRQCIIKRRCYNRISGRNNTCNKRVSIT